MEQLITVAVGVLALALLVLIIALVSAKEEFSDTPKAGYDLRNPLTKLQEQSLRIQSITEPPTDVVICDISKWEGLVNFFQMIFAGASGVIIKCGQGRALDPMFKVFWVMAKLAGIKRGSYWFYDSRIDPKTQAELWAKALAGDSGELPHFADYEENYHGKFAGVHNFAAFFGLFQKLSSLPDKRLGIYTGFYYWMTHGGMDSYFRRFWLWLAWYASAAKVRIPRPWTSDQLLLWQFTASGNGVKYGGTSAEMDLSYFVKGKSEFVRMFGNTPELTPETLVATTWYRVNAANGLKIRSGAGSGNPQIGSLLDNDQIEAGEPVVGWLPIQRILRDGVDIPLPGTSSWCSGAYCVKIAPPVTTPPPAEPTVMHTVKFFDDFSVQVDNGEIIP